MQTATDYGSKRGKVKERVYKKRRGRPGEVGRSLNRGDGSTKPNYQDPNT